MFSERQNNIFRVTPLGAAIVEAMPDRKAAAKIKRDFHRTGTCPTSCLFPTEESMAGFKSEAVKENKNG